MPFVFSKFYPIGRQVFETQLVKVREGNPSAKWPLLKLRPRLRSILITIASGEAIPPEIIWMQLGVFFKSAALRAEVFTIAAKKHGLRLQSSEIHIGPPGYGKGLSSA